MIKKQLSTGLHFESPKASALAEMLDEPPDYGAMCEHQKPMTAWGELYRTASALADDWDSLDSDYAGFLNSAAAAATDDDLLAGWQDP